MKLKVVGQPAGVTRSEFSEFRREVRQGFREGRKDLHATVEALADAVRQGFEGVDARFNAVDARFDAMDQKIDKVRDDLKGDISSLHCDIRRIDNRLGRQQEIIDETKQTARILDGRMAVVEAKVGAA